MPVLQTEKAMVEQPVIPRLVIYRRKPSSKFKLGFYDIPHNLFELLSKSDDEFKNEVVEYNKAVFDENYDEVLGYDIIILDPVWHGIHSEGQYDPKYLEEVHHVDVDSKEFKNISVIYAGVERIDFSLGGSDGSDGFLNVEIVDDSERFISTLRDLKIRESATLISSEKLRSSLKTSMINLIYEKEDIRRYYGFFASASLFPKTLKRLVSGTVDLNSLKLEDFSYYFIFPNYSIVCLDLFQKEKGDPRGGRWVRVFTGVIEEQKYSVVYLNKVSYKLKATSLGTLFLKKFEAEDNIYSNFLGFYRYRSTHQRRLNNPTAAVLNALFFSSYPITMDVVLDYFRTTPRGFSVSQNATLPLFLDYLIRIANISSGSKLIGPSDLALFYILTLKTKPSLLSGFENSPFSVLSDFSTEGSVDDIDFLIYKIGEEVLDYYKKVYFSKVSGLNASDFRDQLLSKFLFAVSKNLRMYYKSSIDEVSGELKKNLSKEGYSDENIDSYISQVKVFSGSRMEVFSKYVAGLCAIYNYIVLKYSPLSFMSKFGGLYKEIYTLEKSDEFFKFLEDYYKVIFVDLPIEFSTGNDNVAEKVFNVLKKYSDTVWKVDFARFFVVKDDLSTYLYRCGIYDIVSLQNWEDVRGKFSQVSFDSISLSAVKAILQKEDEDIKSIFGEEIGDKITNFLHYFIFKAFLSNSAFSLFGGNKIQFSRFVQKIRDVLNVIQIETPYGNLFFTIPSILGEFSEDRAQNLKKATITKFLANMLSKFKTSYKIHDGLFSDFLNQISSGLSNNFFDLDPVKVDFDNGKTQVTREIRLFTLPPFFGKISFSLTQNVMRSSSIFTIPLGIDFYNLPEEVNKLLFQISVVDPALYFQGGRYAENIAELNFPLNFLYLTSALYFGAGSILFSTYKSLVSGESFSGVNNLQSATSEKLDIISFESSIKYSTDSGEEVSEPVTVSLEVYSDKNLVFIVKFLKFLEEISDFEDETLTSIGESGNEEILPEFCESMLSLLMYSYILSRSVIVNLGSNKAEVSTFEVSPYNIYMLGYGVLIPQFNYIGTVTNVRVSLVPGSDPRLTLSLGFLAPVALIPELFPISSAELMFLISSFHFYLDINRPEVNSEGVSVRKIIPISNVFTSFFAYILALKLYFNSLSALGYASKHIQTFLDESITLWPNKKNKKALPYALYTNYESSVLSSESELVSGIPLTSREVLLDFGYMSYGLILFYKVSESYVNFEDVKSYLSKAAPSSTKPIIPQIYSEIMDPNQKYMIMNPLELKFGLIISKDYFDKDEASNFREGLSELGEVVDLKEILGEEKTYVVVFPKFEKQSEIFSKAKSSLKYGNFCDQNRFPYLFFKAPSFEDIDSVIDNFEFLVGEIPTSLDGLGKYYFFELFSYDYSTRSLSVNNGVISSKIIEIKGNNYQSTCAEFSSEVFIEAAVRFYSLPMFASLLGYDVNVEDSSYIPKDMTMGVQYVKLSTLRY